MFKNKIIAAMIAVSGLVISAAAQAQAYVGATVGESSWNLDCSGTTTCKKNDTGFKVLGGYNIDAHWGIEATYFSLGTATADVATNVGVANGQLKGTGFDIAGVYRVALGNNWGLFGKLGFGQTKGQVTASIDGFSGTESINSTQPIVGFGATYAINKNLAIRADLDSRRVKVGSSAYNSTGNVTSFNVGAQVSF